MTKLRHPNTFEDAVAQAIALLGREEASKAAGRSQTQVYAWGDPDKDELPNVSQALSLDLACKRATGITPIHDAFEMQLGAVDFAGDHICITDAVLDLHVAMGRLTEAIKAAKSPTGPGGRRYTLAEKRAVDAMAKKVRRGLEAIERANADEPATLHVVGAAE